MGKKRTLYYRRAIWLSTISHDLQEYVDLAHQQLCTTQQRTFSYLDGELQGMNYIQRGSPAKSLLHVAYYVPKQPTSLVPDPAPVQSNDTVEHRPPRKHNYMEGDAFLLIKNNDLIICSSGIREGSVVNYLTDVLKHIGVDEIFDLQQIANVDKVELIRQEGVRKIQLGVSVFRATQDYAQRQTKKTTLMGKLAEEFLNIYAKVNMDSPADLKKYDNLHVKLEISFDARKKGGEVASSSLTSAGRNLFDSEDSGFTIETKSGNKLTSEDIKVSKKVELQEHGKSVLCDSVWTELESYFDELDNSGVLEF